MDLDTGEALALRVTPAPSHDSPVGRGMLLVTRHNRRRGRSKGEGRVANLRRRRRGAYRRLLGRWWEVETVFGPLRGLKAVVGQVEAWMMAWSVVAQLLGEAGLPIARVLLAVA
ncbi:hypothetical protein [Thermus tengchongensis]|uniref:hypothetical protein n=1 Tax=Thermus tengchongensis TaxID=1214928 RepID=UPI001F15D956|nr:hypothetical protein [Thermus tengchongensis]